MKKIIVLTTVLFTSLTAMFAQKADVAGVWLNDKKDAKVEIYKAGDKYSGKIIWIKELYEPDGKTPKKDAKNSNEKLRNRNIVNWSFYPALRLNMVNGLVVNYTILKAAKLTRVK